MSILHNFKLHQNAISLVITKHTDLIYKNNLLKKFFLFRNKFTIFINELKYLLYEKKLF